MTDNRKMIDWVETDTGCWECTSHARSGYYPIIQRGGVMTTIARYIWEECFGWIPKVLYLRHRCDNRFCIRIDHLELGTQVENMQDKKRAGTHGAGEKQSHHKLTWTDVFQIRNSAGVSQYELARRYGVSRTCIELVLNRRNWTHDEYGRVV